MNRFTASIVRLVSLALLSALLFGCAGKAETRRFFWPPLPERPRIEWLASYSTQNDLDKGGFSNLMSGLFGEVAPITFDKPLDIKSDGAGKVYITDVGLGKVVVYDFTKKDVHFLGLVQDNIFAKPISLALDDAGNIYVTDSERKSIFVFDKSEHLLRTVDISGKINAVGGIAVDNEGQRLICVDVRGHKVVVLSMTGDLLLTIGTRGDEDGQFNFPGPVTINKKREIIVGDSMNARIQIFDKNGKFLRKFGRRGDSASEFQLLKGVAVDSDDNIYVTDGKGHKVDIFSSQGEFLMAFGGRASVLESGQDQAAGFVIPQGIFIDRDDKLFVVDQMNYRFQVFQYISDSFIEKYPIPGYPAAPVSQTK